MIRIKAVDEQNLLDVCELTANEAGMGTTVAGCSCCNAVSIAEAKYYPEMHPNAIYNNNVLIGFFMYQRAEDQADIVTICRFMIDLKFQHKGLGKRAFAYALRGLKIQGVKKVILMVDAANRTAQSLCISFGFQSTGKMDHGKCCYELEL